MIKKTCIVLILVLVFTFPIGAYNESKSNFNLVYNNNSLISHTIHSIFVLPDEKIKLDIHEPDNKTKYNINYKDFEMKTKRQNGWTLKAPTGVGNYKITVSTSNNKQFINLNVFVLSPYENLKGEYINGYKIGEYPVIPEKMKDNYKLPKGFIKVTRENEEMYLTPHFQLKQFVCKQGSNYPKYLVLKEDLLNKLEFLLDEVNKKGFNADTFHVLSGYRTPSYNQAIGNVKYSRHVFGDAADIYIDTNKDGQMDDLNNDGKINKREANILANTVNELYNRSEYADYIGGLGSYRKTSTHSPFIHVDTRGKKARW